MRLPNTLENLQTNKKWCVISTVGKASFHRKWIKDNPLFDLHIIVYDDSYNTYKNDTRFITQSKGYKFKLVYDYLKSNQQIINTYDYFYIPDDDIYIDSENIHRLFEYMAEYRLAIAQPALTHSYYSFPDTIKQPNSTLRFTNFVEVMQPCFSKDALQKVLFTFNENKSGWGIDFHWGKLVDYHKNNMAIIDDIISVHTRPLRSNHFSDLDEYLQKYNLTMQIKEIRKVK
jgi:hypothetical protein